MALLSVRSRLSLGMLPMVHMLPSPSCHAWKHAPPLGKCKASDFYQVQHPLCHLRTAIKRHVTVATAITTIGGPTTIGATTGVNLAGLCPTPETTNEAPIATGEPKHVTTEFHLHLLKKTPLIKRGFSFSGGWPMLAVYRSSTNHKKYLSGVRFFPKSRRQAMQVLDFRCRPFADGWQRPKYATINTKTYALAQESTLLCNSKRRILVVHSCLREKENGI